MYLDLLQQGIMFQKAESLEELVAQFDEDQRDVLVFSFNPLLEQDIMAAASLLERKINIFSPSPMSNDLLINLKLQLDSRHNKKTIASTRYNNKIAISICRLFLYENQTGDHVILQEIYAIKGNNYSFHIYLKPYGQ